jgi:hypothetical protein
VSGEIIVLERPKWGATQKPSAEYTATLKYDIQIAHSTVQGNIVIGILTIMK